MPWRVGIEKVPRTQSREPGMVFPSKTVRGDVEAILNPIAPWGKREKGGGGG